MEDNEYLIKQKVKLPNQECAKIVSVFANMFYSVLQQQFEDGVPIEVIHNVVEGSILNMKNQFDLVQVTHKSIAKSIFRAIVEKCEKSQDKKDSETQSDRQTE